MSGKIDHRRINQVGHERGNSKDPDGNMRVNQKGDDRDEQQHRGNITER